MSGRLPTVAIVGNGPNAVITLSQLIEQAEPGKPFNVTLFSKVKDVPNGEIGAGQVATTSSYAHILNVLAGNMSANPDENAEFVTWLKENKDIWLTHELKETFAKIYPQIDLNDLDNIGNQFVPRMVWGVYMNSVFQTIKEQAQEKGINLNVVVGDVTAIEPVKDNPNVLTITSNGKKYPVDHVSTAFGFAPKKLEGEQKLRGIEGYSGSIYLPSSGSFLSGNNSGKGKTLVLVGTGLSTVDALAQLAANDYQGRVICISPSGRFPNPHLEKPASKPYQLQVVTASDLPKTAAELYSQVTHEYALAGVAYNESKDKGKPDTSQSWQAVADALRKVTPKIWQALPVPEQARFQRTMASAWGDLRHRIPVQNQKIIKAMQKTGQLEIINGRAKSVARGAGRFAVTVDTDLFNPQGKKLMKGTIYVEGDEFASSLGWNMNMVESIPLVRQMAEAGLVEAAPHSMGFRIKPEHASTLSAAGHANVWLLYENTGIGDTKNDCRKTAGNILKEIERARTSFFTRLIHDQPRPTGRA